MHHFVAIVFLFFSGTPGIAQDSAWERKEIDANMSLALPGDVTKINPTASSVSFSAATENVHFTLVITSRENDDYVDVPEYNDQLLQEVRDRTLKTQSSTGSNCSSLDTTIDEVRCVKLACKYTEQDRDPGIYTYIFVLNSKIYILQGGIIGNTTVAEALSDIQHVIQSIRFDTTATEEEQTATETKVGRMPPNVARLLIFMAVISVVIIVPWIIITSKKSK